LGAWGDHFSTPDARELAPVTKPLGLALGKGFAPLSSMTYNESLI